MSNSTRPGGYDERLVVPLEASRRGAHRARVSRLLAALPLLAVVVVVAAVIGVAYTLFLRPANNTADPLGSAPNPGATSSAPAPSAAGNSPSQPAPSANSSASTGSAATSGTVDKGVKFTVYNGSVPAVTGLAAKGESALSGAKFTWGKVLRGTPPAKVKRTTVFYANEADAATARAMANALGVGVTKLSPDVAGSGIVVIVANDLSP